MKDICFGDSNTYGYDPRSWLGGRYDADICWVNILAAKTGWTIRNMGENGREINCGGYDVPNRHRPANRHAGRQQSAPGT